MKKQLKSFGAAFAGIYRAIRSEAHLRFHIVAAFYVVYIGQFYGFSAVQWAVLAVLIGAVIAAELFNTAVESLCDRVTEDYDPRVKAAKDCSAAAVLVLSIAAVAVAFLFFFDLDRIYAVLMFFASRVWLLILFVLSLIISVVFIGFFKDKK